MIQMSSARGQLPWLRLSQNTAQSIANNTLQKVSWDTVSASGGGWAAPTAPVTDIVLPYSGIVLIVVHDLDWQDSGNGVGYRLMLFRKNDASVSSRSPGIVAPVPAAAASQTVQSASKVMSFVAGDTLQLYLRQTSGGTLAGAAVADMFLQYIALGSYPFSGVN